MTKALKLLAISAAFVATQASAALVGDFQLNGTTANAAGGPLNMASNGGSFGTTGGATGLNFAANFGPSVLGFASPTDFSIETRFRFDTVSGFRKIADFLGRTSDTGLYNQSGYLNFYNVAQGPTQPIVAGQFVNVILTRASNGATVGYVNGVQQFSFVNASLTAVNSSIDFFQDDNQVGGEASAGFVDYIRVYDTALTAAEVAGLNGTVPEPAAWALMIGGFGLVGAASRRRRTATVLA